MQQDLNLTRAFITSLTGSPDTVCDWRVINDRNKGEQGINLRGSLATLAKTLIDYNERFYGVFMTVNAMKPDGPRTLENVDFIRAQVADIDDVLTAQDSYNRAVSSATPPHFAVQSSQGKFHLYWLVEPYQGNDFYTQQQRKLAQFYNGDSNVIDATRVLRVPGFLHCKSTPQLVTCWGISNNPRYTHQQIADSLANVNIVERIGNRYQLGEPDLQAPSIEWLNFALTLVNPNDLIREDWLALSAAYKQAGWSLSNDEALRTHWLEWCAGYKDNDEKENIKLWNSIKDSEVGWGRFRRVTNVDAYINANSTPPTLKIVKEDEESYAPNPDDFEGMEVIDTDNKKVWFKNCYFVEREGRIFSPTGRFMNQTQFNGRYGGKEYVTKRGGARTTDDAWKAALRSTDWRIPNVDHCRFLPDLKPFTIVDDDLGRKGLNTYIPAIIRHKAGNVERWIDYLHRVFNTADDVKIFNDYVAHCIKYPGYKIPWSVLLQSAKGIGKQMIGDVIKFCIGESYTYQPDAEELVSGVSQFNGWMRNKLMILVDEVRVGDRNDLMNGLKTIITDRRIAVESKGVDQEMEDNVANWVFFSNFKDAFPIDENERRYCIFYSKLQTAVQIADAGLDKNFFDSMYHWLELEDGYEQLADFYLNYPIEKGALPHRAPHTSSYDEVIRIGRSPLRIILDDKLELKERGFRGGYVSFTMFQKAVADSSAIRTKPLEHTLKAIVENAGFEELGYTKAPVTGEDLTHCSLIYGKRGMALTVDEYEKAQA